MLAVTFGANMHRRGCHGRGGGGLVGRSAMCTHAVKILNYVVCAWQQGTMDNAKNLLAGTMDRFTKVSITVPL